MTSSSNRHPVDELADLRAKIAKLEGRADYLRRTIIAGGCSLEGDEHVAMVKTTARQVLDTKAVRQEFGDARLRPFMVERKADQVFVRAKSAAAQAKAPASAEGEF